MRHLLEFFKDIIPIVFVVGIVAVGFLFYSHVKSVASSGMEKIYSMDLEIENSDILVYDGMTVSGSEIVTFVKKNFKTAGTQGAFAISVSDINAGSTLTSKNLTGIVNSALYTCAVTTENGSVKTVTFTKKA